MIQYWQFKYWARIHGHSLYCTSKRLLSEQVWWWWCKFKWIYKCKLFFNIAYVFFYVYTCVHISMFFFIIYSGFVSSLKNSKLLPRKRPSPITITKLAWHWVATVEGQTNNLVLRSHFPVRLSIIQSWIIARSCVCGMAVLISLHFSYVQGRCFNVCKSPMEELFSWSAQCFRRTVQLRP